MPAVNPRHHRLLEILALCAILTLHAVALRAYFVPALGGPDANAYQVCARMVEEHGRFHQQPKADEFAHTGRMWVRNERGEWYPKYPPLYPALSGVVMKVFGTDAGWLVSPFCAWLVVLGVYVLCRARLPGWAAVLAAWIVSTTPVFNLFAVDQVSHPPSLLFLVWGYALFFHGTGTGGRRRTVLFAAAGLLVGYSVGVRYPNALMALPPMLWMALRWRDNRAAAMAWLAGLTIPAVLLAWYHQVSFGSPLRTAYSLTDEQGAFALTYFVKNLRLYVPALLTDGFGPLLVLSCCGFVWVWFRDWRRGAFYALWIAPLTVLYVSYYWAPEQHPPSYIRFLLPLTPAWILLALFFLRDVLQALGGSPGQRRAIIAVVVLCQGGWGVASSLAEMERRYANNAESQRRTAFLRAEIPPGSTVFADVWWLDELEYYEEHTLYPGFLLRRDQLELLVSRIDLPGPDSMQAARAAHLKESLIDVEPAVYRARITALIDAQLQATPGVYLAGTAATCAAARASLSPTYRFEEVAVLPATTKRHCLFTPGASLSRAWPTTREPIEAVQVLRILQTE